MLLGCFFVELRGEDKYVCLRKLDPVNELDIGCSPMFPEVDPGNEGLGMLVEGSFCMFIRLVVVVLVRGVRCAFGDAVICGMAFSPAELQRGFGPVLYALVEFVPKVTIREPGVPSSVWQRMEKEVC